MNYQPKYYEAKPARRGQPAWPNGIKMSPIEQIERGLTEGCEETGKGHSWLLLPQQEGQKQYIICLDCHEQGHT